MTFFPILPWYTTGQSDGFVNADAKQNPASLRKDVNDAASTRLARWFMAKRSVLYVLGAVIAFLIVAWMWRGSGDPQRTSPVSSDPLAESRGMGRDDAAGVSGHLPGSREFADSTDYDYGVTRFGELEDVRKIVVGDAPEILIEGRVLNEADGSPVASAELTVSEPAPPDLFPLLPSHREMKFAADALGRFRLELKRRQSFTLSAEADGFQKRTLNNIEPVSQSGLIVLLTPFLRVEGYIVDPTDRGIADAAVWINRTDRDEYARNVDWSYSGEDGRFEFSRVSEPGEYWISAAHVEHPALEPAPVTLERGDNSLKLILEPAGGERATIWGRVVDTENLPVGGAEVSIGESVSLGFGLRLASTHTDRDGYYRFSSIRFGRYNLSCSAEGFATTGGLHRSASVTVDGAALEYRRDCTLSPSGHLSGTVIDDEGAPVAAASVTAFHEIGMSRGWTTGEDGRFLLEGLEHGEYIVLVKHFNYQGLQVEVAVPHEGDLRLRLRKGLALFGAATDLRGGPVESFTLTLTDPTQTHPWKRMQFNNPDGRFRMDGISPGTYSLNLQTPDGKNYSGPLQISEDLWATLRVDLSHPEGGSLTIQASAAPPGNR